MDGWSMFTLGPRLFSGANSLLVLGKGSPIFGFFRRKIFHFSGSATHKGPRIIHFLREISLDFNFPAGVLCKLQPLTPSEVKVGFINSLFSPGLPLKRQRIPMSATKDQGNIFSNYPCSMGILIILPWKKDLYLVDQEFRKFHFMIFVISHSVRMEFQ